MKPALGVIVTWPVAWLMLIVALAGTPNVVASPTLYTTPLPPLSVDVNVSVMGVPAVVDWLLTGPSVGFTAGVGGYR